MVLTVNKYLFSHFHFARFNLPYIALLLSYMFTNSLNNSS